MRFTGKVLSSTSNPMLLESCVIVRKELRSNARKCGTPRSPGSLSQFGIAFKRDEANFCKFDLFLQIQQLCSGLDDSTYVAGCMRQFALLEPISIRPSIGFQAIVEILEFPIVKHSRI